MLKSKGRPENILPAELYYNKSQARKYTNSSRIMKIQKEMTERAIQLLNFPKDNKPRLVLDLGCGSGISGSALTNEGLFWIGCDISNEMLEIAKGKKYNSCGDLLLNDIGQGVPFRIGVFDGVISISCLQWLVTNYNKQQNAYRRMAYFFSSLYKVVKKGGKAVFQFYPENAEQTKIITKAATKAGFTGGVVIDFPNSRKARKFYLVLFSGTAMETPKPLMEEHVRRIEKNDDSEFGGFEGKEGRRNKRKKIKGGKRRSLKEYIIKKKVRDRVRGRKTANDSKYTGRKRNPKF